MNRTKASAGTNVLQPSKQPIIRYKSALVDGTSEKQYHKKYRYQDQDNRMPKSFLIKNCAPKELESKVDTQTLDFQVLPIYAQNTMSGVYPTNTVVDASMRWKLPHGYNPYQGAQHFRVAPPFAWVPAMPLPSPFYPNGNIPVFTIDDTNFPRKEPWRCSNPIYRTDGERKLMNERGESAATLPRFAPIHSHSYGPYLRSTDQDQLVRYIGSPSSSAVENKQATSVLHAQTMHLGNASSVIPDRRYNSELVPQQTAHLPLGSSRSPVEVNDDPKHKHHSSVVVKEEQRQPRQKEDINNSPYRHSLDHNNKNYSQVPTVIQSCGPQFTTEDDKTPTSTVWYNNLGEQNSATKADTRGYPTALGLTKDTDGRIIEGGMAIRSQPESAGDEVKSGEAVKELPASEYYTKLPTRPPVTKDESSSRVAQNSGVKDRESQEIPSLESSTAGGLQSVTTRTEQTPAKAKARHHCDECGQTFTRSSTLTTHKRIHTGEKPYACEQCGRAFRQLGNLSRHRLTHTTSKPYVCPHCDKAFNRASNLHTHMRTHSDYKPFTCEFCDKRFHQKIDMKIHRYMHTGEKPHKCTKCGRGFKQLTHLTYHLRTHSKERLYKCDVCGKGFNQKGNLKAHVYRHTGERPFKCDICSKGFTLASTLNTHKRIHAETKPFQCQFCDKAFYQKNALKTHYVASHPYTGGVLLL